MRQITGVVICIGLVFAASAHAAEVEIEPRLAVSLPAGDTRESLATGFHGALDLVVGQGRAAAVLDFGYHYWPGSREARDAFDESLSLITGTTVTGTKLSSSAVEAMIHVRQEVVSNGSATVWVQAGAGLFGLRDHLEFPPVMIVGPLKVDASRNKFGYSLGAGLDFLSVRGMRLGTDLSYRIVDLGASDPGNLTVVDLGLHLGFGRTRGPRSGPSP